MLVQQSAQFGNCHFYVIILTMPELLPHRAICFFILSIQYLAFQKFIVNLIHVKQATDHSPNCLRIIHPLTASKAYGNCGNGAITLPALLALPHLQLLKIFRMPGTCRIQKILYRTEKSGLAKTSRPGDQSDLFSASQPLSNKMGLVHIKLLAAGKIAKILVAAAYLGIQIRILLQDILQRLIIFQKPLLLLFQTLPLLKFQQDLLSAFQLHIHTLGLALYGTLDVRLLLPIDGLVGQGSLGQFFQSAVNLLKPHFRIIQHGLDPPSYHYFRSKKWLYKVIPII